jgi:predicted GIY-YIG superfamily endonuclease
MSREYELKELSRRAKERLVEGSDPVPGPAGSADGEP